MKKRLIPLLALALALTSCGPAAPAPADPPVASMAPAPVNFADPNLFDPGYTDRDLDDTWEDAVNITLADNATRADGPGVEIDGNIVTIGREGSYVLSGTLSAGQIRVILPGDNDKARLILNGVDVTCANGPALYVIQGDKVFLTLAPGSENILTDGEKYDLELNEDEPNAALFSKEDLTINGSGSLTVQANYRHGILSKDSLTIAGGTITVHAAEDGLRGRDSVAIRDGNLSITAGSDGIQSNNDESSDRGWISLDGGVIAVTAENDGVQAETALQITGGTLSITTGGGSEAVTGEESWQREGMPDMFGGGRGGPMPGGMNPPEGMQEMGEPPEMPEGMPQPPEGMAPPEDMPGPPPEGPGGQFPGPAAGLVTENAPSAKGLKAGTSLHLYGGTITLDCADDAIHSDGDVTVSGGTIHIRTGDDGAHADDTLSIADGILTVSVSREGLEGGRVEISGGVIDVTARDDGMNAAGGSDGTETDTGAAAPFDPDRFHGDGSSIRIGGGTVRVNAGGDGLDSNGSIEMTGGFLAVDGPVSEGDGALDYGGQAVISGGTAVLVGSGRMALGFAESSPQGFRMIQFPASQPAGTTLALVDPDGAILLEFTAAKAFSSAIFSAPGMGDGAELYVNGTVYRN